MDYGKQFEKDFKGSFQEHQGARLLRLYDSVNGYKSIATICDFIYYTYPRIGFFELKSVMGKSLPFTNITENQWEGLLIRSKIPGMVGAVLIQFRDYKEGYLVPIQALETIKKTGKKSINIDEARELGMPLNLIYKRTRCSVDEHKFREDFIKYANKWEGV